MESSQSTNRSNYHIAVYLDTSNGRGPFLELVNLGGKRAVDLYIDVIRLEAAIGVAYDGAIAENLLAVKTDFNALDVGFLEPWFLSCVPTVPFSCKPQLIFGSVKSLHCLLARARFQIVPPLVRFKFLASHVLEGTFAVLHVKVSCILNRTKEPVTEIQRTEAIVSRD